MKIGERIAARRKELGLTLEEVGNYVGVTKATVRKWETGYIANMRRDKIALLAKVLDISPTEFISADCETIDTKQEQGYILSADEKKLLTAYRSFNAEGQERLLQYAEDMTNLDRYKKECSKSDLA